MQEALALSEISDVNKIDMALGAGDMAEIFSVCLQASASKDDREVLVVYTQY